MLGRWITESESDDGQAFRGHGKLTPEQLELRQLREENKRLKMERDILKKATVVLCKRNEVRYSFITQYNKTWPVAIMYPLLEVTSSNYYSYQKRNQDNTVGPDHEEMLEWIRNATVYSDNTYGSRRMQKVLNALSFSVSRRKSAQLMKAANV